MNGGGGGDGGEYTATNWTRTIKIKQHLDPDKPLDEVRGPIVATLRRDLAYKDEALGGDWEFAEIVDDMAEAETVQEFDLLLSSLYDWADSNLVWIGGEPSYRRSVDV